MGWKPPLDREVPTAYRRMDRGRKIAVPAALILFAVYVALGATPLILAYPALAGIVQLALRGHYERIKANRLAKDPRFSREELRRAHTRDRRVVLVILVAGWTFFALALVVRPSIVTALFLVVTSFGGVALMWAMRRYYDRRIAEERPEHV